MIPTIESLGEMALNQAIAQRVVPIELANHEFNGIFPDSYFRHDMSHAFNGYGLDHGKWFANFHRGFMKKLSRLTVEERIMAELVYFAIGHEQANKEQIKDIYLKKRSTRTHVVHSLQRSMAAFKNLNTSILLQMKHSHFIERSISVFQRIAHEVIQEENIHLPSDEQGNILHETKPSA